MDRDEIQKAVDEVERTGRRVVRAVVRELRQGAWAMALVDDAGGETATRPHHEANDAVLDAVEANDMLRERAAGGG